MGIDEERFWRMTPRQFDRHGRAWRERREAKERAEWQRTCMVLDALLNYGGMRGKDFKPVKLGYHYEQLFETKATGNGGKEPVEGFADRERRALSRLAERRARATQS